MNATRKSVGAFKNAEIYIRVMFVQVLSLIC